MHTGVRNLSSCLKWLVTLTTMLVYVPASFKSYKCKKTYQFKTQCKDDVMISDI